MCTGTGPGLTPAIRVGKGAGVAGSLLPGDLAPWFDACRGGVSTETYHQHNVRTTTTTTRLNQVCDLQAQMTVVHG